MLERFFVIDQSYRTISESLALPSGTVASRISRALGRLRGELEELADQVEGRRGSRDELIGKTGHRQTAAAAVALVGLLGSILPVGADASIYWSDYGVGRVRMPMISCANLDGSGVTHSFIPTYASDLAVDRTHLYWLDPVQNSIGRANLDGSAVNAGLITGLPDWVGGIAVDDAHLYWTALDLGAIGRVNLDGTDIDWSLITGLSDPFGVAVDGGHVYWTEYADPLATIGRAGIDGSGVDRSLISLDWAVEEQDLAVGGGYLYWDWGEIGRARLDGSGMTPGLITGVGDVVGLAVAGDHLYWAAAERMGRADLDGSNSDQEFIVSDQSMESLAVAPSSGCPASGPGRARAKQTQSLKGEKVRVEVRVTATDRLTAEVRGKVKVNPAYALEPVSKRIDTGESKAMTLKPKRRRAQERIAAALRQGEKATARLTVKLSDDADNAEVEKLSVKLKRS